MQIDFAVREADFPKADSLYRSQPGPLLDTLQYRTLQAFKTNDVAKQEALFRAYEQDTAIAAGMIGYRMLHEMENPDAATRFANLALKEQAREPQKKRAPVVAALVDAERGHMRSALKHLRGSTVSFKRVAYTDFANMPLYRMPAEDLAALRAEIERSDSTAVNAEPSGQMRPHVRLYRLAIMACRAGDFQAAAQYAQRMRSLPTPATMQSSIALLATEIDAQIDVENGRPLEALRRLEQHKNTVAADIGSAVSWGAGPAVWRAEALFQAGRYEEAQKWFDVVDEVLVDNQPHIAWILLRRAQIADARNDGAKARDLYARFLKLWNQPDAELRPIVDQARSRLAALQADAG